MVGAMTTAAAAWHARGVRARRHSLVDVRRRGFSAAATTIASSSSSSSSPTPAEGGRAKARPGVPLLGARASLAMGQPRRWVIPPGHAPWGVASFRGLAASASSLIDRDDDDARIDAETTRGSRPSHPLGLPVRPGERVCAFYMRRGTCGFGDGCRYDHPPEYVDRNTGAFVGVPRTPKEFKRKAIVRRMRAAADAKDFDAVFAAFDELSVRYPENQSVAAFEILLKCAASMGDPDAALQTMEAMMSMGYAPKLHTHGKIIAAYGKAGNPRKGLEWLRMLLESDGRENAREMRSGEWRTTSTTLFNRVLDAAARVADEALFREAYAEMTALKLPADEGTLHAFLEMEAKVGDAASVERVWRREEFAHLAHPRSAALGRKRVEALCKVGSFLLRPRNKSRGGRGGNKLVGGSRGEASGEKAGSEWDQVKLAAAEARRLASEALDEMYEQSYPSLLDRGTSRLATNRREIRNATTHLINAFAVVGNTAAIQRAVDKLATMGIAPDHYMNNALLRSEAADRSLGMVDGMRLDDGADEDEDDADKDDLDEMLDIHQPELQKAVVRVEESMRAMVENGLEPDLHSFMALLTAYAKVGDVAAAGDALSGMQARGISLDTWAYNCLLQACSTACDLEAAGKIWDQMKASGVPPDDITFLHLISACARRTRQVAEAANHDAEDADDWDDWIGAGAGVGPVGVKPRTHAALTGALVDSSEALSRAPTVRETARAMADYAKQGFSSAYDLIKGTGEDGAWDDANRRAGGIAADVEGESPEIARARAALVRFRDDMEEFGVVFSPQSAAALIQSLGSLREYETMMHFLRHPPAEIATDVNMYNNAIRALAKARQGQGEGSGMSTAGFGPATALKLADEMVAKGLKPTQRTLNCVLQACATLGDWREAEARYEAHVGAGCEVGINTFNLLFKVANKTGRFARTAPTLAEMLERRNLSPNGATRFVLEAAEKKDNQDAAVAEALLVRFGFKDAHRKLEAYKTMYERGWRGDGDGGAFMGQDDDFDAYGDGSGSGEEDEDAGPGDRGDVRDDDEEEEQDAESRTARKWNERQKKKRE